jgi:hypothetical protein
MPYPHASPHLYPPITTTKNVSEIETIERRAQMLQAELTTTQKADALLDEIRKDAYSRQHAALDAGNLPEWLHATDVLETHKVRQSVEWIFELDGFENYSFTDFAEHEYGSEVSDKWEKQAGRVIDMYSQLCEIDTEGKLPADPDNIRVMFKRNRDQGYYTYDVVSILPPGSKRIFSSTEEDQQSVLFTYPDTPCVNHACDIIYKEFREAGSHSKSGQSGYLPVEPVRDLYAFVNGQGGGLIEFMDPETRETLNQRRYVMCAVFGIYDNIKSIEIPPELLPTERLSDTPSDAPRRGKSRL